MKKLLLAAAAVALFGLACKKSSSSASSTYYIKASLNDTAMTFNVDCMAVVDTLAGFITVAIIGDVSNPNNLQGIDLQINNTPSNQPIVAGTYSELNTTNFVTAGVYNPGSTTVVYGSGEFANPTNPFTLIITSIDSKTIKGTFSGDLYYTNTSTATVTQTKKTITNGEFYVQIKKP